MKKKFLNLNRQPFANKYPSLTYKRKKKEQFYNLQVGFNTKTKLVSILKTVPSKKMFDKNYPYRSSMSKTMLLSFKKFSQSVKKKINPKLFLEIGSNDGSLIKNFKKEKVICVEPCTNHAKITKKIGYKTYPNYWNLKLAKKIKTVHGEVDCIYAANTITHIHNLDKVFKSIQYILSNDGILIIEDPSLLECIKIGSYDQFYNEHIHIFSLISLSNILNKHKLQVFNVERLDTHGGSLRFFIKKKMNKKIKINKSVNMQILKEKKYGLDKFKTYKNFSNRVFDSRYKLRKILSNLKKNKKKIIGYGATAKSVTILNYCKIDKSLINHFVDTTPDKIGKYMPGTNIIIKKYKKNSLKKIDYVFLGAWNFKKEIFKKEKKFLKKGCKFITHIPYPKILN